MLPIPVKSAVISLCLVVGVCAAADKPKAEDKAPSWVPKTLWQWTDIPGSTPNAWMPKDGSGILPKAWAYGQGSESYHEQIANGGPCWSDKHKELWFAGQGGHKASNMNPVVKARLNQDKPDWVALDPGSSMETVKAEWDAGGSVWRASPYFKDGRKKADHSYRDTQYFDCVDEVLCFGVNACCDPEVDVASWNFDIAGWPRDGKAWRPRDYWGKIAASDGQGIGYENCLCQSFDGSGLFSTHGHGGGPLHFFDVKNKTWKDIGARLMGWDGYMRMAENNAHTILQCKNINNGAISLWLIDTEKGGERQVTTSGDALPPGQPIDLVFSSAAGSWFVVMYNGQDVPWAVTEVKQTGASAATLSVRKTSGTAPVEHNQRRGAYYCSDWKCIVAMDGFFKPLKILRVAP